MTATPTPPAKSRGVAYAENELGVHEVHTTAERLRDELDGLHKQIVAARAQRRVYEDMIETLELDIYSDERGKHADLSIAALERHLKVELNKNSDLRTLKSKLSEIVTGIEALDYDIKAKTVDIQIAVARMNELGGYLNYLAAIKQAGQTKHT